MKNELTIRKEISDKLPPEIKEEIENHKRAAANHEEAARHHYDSVRLYELGDHEAASKSKAKAHKYAILAMDVHSDDVK